MNNFILIQAQIAQSTLENCVIQLLIEYYKEYTNTEGATPSEISKTLGIFRGTKIVKDGMRMNDAIVTGLLQNLMLKGMVEKIEKSRGQYCLTNLGASSFNLL